MNGNNISESSLIEALSVDQEQQGEGLTRGFKPATPGSVAAPTKKVRKHQGPAKANLMITFASASAELTPEDRKILEVLGKALQSDALAGLSFRVEGHADPRGDTARNLLLSQQRADAVAMFLTQNLGILAERLTTIGKGSSDPINKRRLDAPENRRVTIVTVKP